MVDVMSVLGHLREYLLRLVDLLQPVSHPNDAEEVEVFLADPKRRESFYNLLCTFGRTLNVVLNASRPSML